MRKSTKITALISILGTIIFAIFDYFGYNEAAKSGEVNEKFINPYRILQMIVQIGIAVACYFLGGYIAVIVFMILWWTWVCDWLFYALGELLGIYGRGWIEKEPFGNVVTWAWWTPYGLLDLLISGKDKETKYFKIINWKILAIQSFIGIILTILIITLW